MLPRESEERWIIKAHLALGAMVCVGMPLASYVDGTGRLAYTMFSATQFVRLEILATNATGQVAEVPPSHLAPLTSTTAAQFLTGAETFHRRPINFQVRAHLDDVAGLACRAAHAAKVVVTLYERKDESSPVVTFVARKECGR